MKRKWDSNSKRAETRAERREVRRVIREEIREQNMLRIEIVEGFRRLHREVAELQRDVEELTIDVHYMSEDLSRLLAGKSLDEKHGHIDQCENLDEYVVDALVEEFDYTEGECEVLPISETD